jgi:peptide/nickel transport system substrate-binding protein
VTAAVAGLLAIVLFAGCAPEPQEVPEPRIPTDYSGIPLTPMRRAYEAGVSGGSLSLAVTEWFTSLNPVLAVGTTADRRLIDALFARPIRRDPITGRWAPHLAESFSVTENGIEITLREDFSWSDGEPVTVADAVYSLTALYLNRAYPTYAADLADGIGGTVSVQRSGERSYTISCTRPHRAIYQLASLPPLPRHVVEPFITEHGAAAFLTLWPSWREPSTVVGSGPFMVALVEPDTRIALARNPGYPLADEQGTPLPYLDELELVVVPPDSEVPSLAGGAVDVARVPAATLGVAVDQLPASITLIADTTDSPGTFVAFNTNPRDDDGRGVSPDALALLDDLRFRRATAALIDHETLIETELAGQGLLQAGYLSPASPYALANAAELLPEYNPKAAGSLLQELGIAADDDEPRAVEIMVNAENELRMALADRLAVELNALGVAATVRVEPFQVIASRIYSTYEWQIVILGMDRPSDPNAFDEVLPSWGLLHIPEPSQTNPRHAWEREMDMLWRESTRTLDEAAYTEQQHRMQQIFMENLPWINVAGPYTYYAATVPVGNLMTSAFNLRTLPVDRLFITPSQE